MSAGEGPRADEELAFLVAERTLGVRADPQGRQAPIDAYFYDGGRRVAFEVISVAADRARQLDSLLADENHSWPLPEACAWWWSIWIHDVKDLPRLRDCYEHVMKLCEQHRVSRPEALPRAVAESDQDIAWLLTQSPASLVGCPEVPARDGGRVRSATVVPAGRAGPVDHDLAGLRDALGEVFGRPVLRRHFDKLLEQREVDDRHLFVAVHESALPFSVFDGLAFGNTLPPDPPPVPDGITGLWLAAEYSRRVLLWHSGTWKQFEPYDWK